MCAVVRTFFCDVHFLFFQSFGNYTFLVTFPTSLLSNLDILNSILYKDIGELPKAITEWESSRTRVFCIIFRGGSLSSLWSLHIRQKCPKNPFSTHLVCDGETLGILATCNAGPWTGECRNVKLGESSSDRDSHRHLSWNGFTALSQRVDHKPSTK